jgi:ATP phosphoribosyltransferase
MADTQQEVKKQEAVAPMQPQGSAEVPPQLSIADLQALLNIIDAASSRGAFRANELSNVGRVVDKLTKFLQHIDAQQKAQEKEKGSASKGSVDAGTVSGGDAKSDSSKESKAS